MPTTTDTTIGPRIIQSNLCSGLCVLQHLTKMQQSIINITYHSTYNQFYCKDLNIMHYTANLGFRCFCANVF